MDNSAGCSTHSLHLWSDKDSNTPNSWTHARSCFTRLVALRLADIQPCGNCAAASCYGRLGCSSHLCGGGFSSLHSYLQRSTYLPDLLHGCRGILLDLGGVGSTCSHRTVIGSVVLQLCHMSNTLTVRLPEDLQKRLREKARRTGLPMGRIVCDSLEKTLDKDESAGGNHAWRNYVGIFKGGPRDLSSRKGYSRK